MDILFNNPLATMSGVVFLIFFAIVIIFALIVLALIKSQIDKSDKMNLPPIPANIDPYEIAYLRGGTNEMARSVVFSLMQKGFIEFKIIEKTSDINRVNPQQSVSGLPQIEQTALNWIGEKREAKEVFDANYGLVTQLENFGLNYHRRLESAQMLTNSGMEKQLSIWKWTASFGIFLLALYKIIAAIVHGHFNFIFTIILSLVGVIVIASFINLPRLTKLGKAYLERLQLAFENLKLEAQAPYIPNGHFQGAPRTAFAGVDPLLLSVGVFGSAILAGTIYDSYNHAFSRAQNQSMASGSACSSGCGSCSTGSSCSSGDSGGSSCSSCGGGCGGGD